MEQELLFRYFRGETSQEEEERILSWVEASPANRAEFRKAHLLFAGLALYAPAPASDTARPKPRRTLLRIARYAVRTAAAVIVMVGAAYLGKVVYHHSLAEREMSVFVPAGQRMQVTLADGTHVQLNAGTTLEYPVVFSSKTRRVKLSGEALFEVTHDPSHPFIVETFATDIQVLGTKFNVLADSENGLFSTTLVGGPGQGDQPQGPGRIHHPATERPGCPGAWPALQGARSRFRRFVLDGRADSSQEDAVR